MKIVEGNPKQNALRGKPNPLNLTYLSLGGILRVRIRVLRQVDVDDHGCGWRPGRRGWPLKQGAGGGSRGSSRLMGIGIKERTWRGFSGAHTPGTRQKLVRFGQSDMVA